MLDMDSSECPTYDEQERSAYHGHSRCTCYHPLFVFNQPGDLKRCALRPSNVHSADGWCGVPAAVVSRYPGKRHIFGATWFSPHPDIYEFPEIEGTGYGIQLPANRGPAGQDWMPTQAPGRSTAA